MLILGCGSEDRSDDIAGWVAVRRLRELGIDASEHNGDPLELIESWTGNSSVMVIDAVVTGASPGTISVWDASRSPLPAEAFRCSTHALGLADAVELARVLGRLPSQLTIYGIEAARFDRGGALSPAVAAGAGRLVRQIVAQLCASA